MNTFSANTNILCIHMQLTKSYYQPCCSPAFESLGGAESAHSLGMLDSNYFLYQWKAMPNWPNSIEELNKKSNLRLFHSESLHGQKVWLQKMCPKK